MYACLHISIITHPYTHFNYSTIRSYIIHKYIHPSIPPSVLHSLRPSLRPSIPVEVAEQLRSQKIDFFLKSLGLGRAQDTIIGNDLLRGVSGGEKKRVTLGEMLIAPRLAYFLDEISTGLDR